MNSIFIIPSFYAHVLNGFFMLLAMIISYRNFAEIKKLDSYKRIVLTLLFSITVGIHGLSHLGLENVYNFNPLYNRFI